MTPTRPRPPGRDGRPPTPAALRRRFPQLARLFGAYVNEDFDAFGGTPEDAVRAFSREARPVEVAAAHAEVERLLAEATDEASLDRVLGALRCGYLPSADGRTARAFLDAVRTVLARR